MCVRACDIDDHKSIEVRVSETTMAGGAFTTSGGGKEFEAKITPIVIISCIMAATGGLMFGYDVGVSGNAFFFSYSLSSESLVRIHNKIKQPIARFLELNGDLAIAIARTKKF